jgi:hypothetical protein
VTALGSLTNCLAWIQIVPNPNTLTWHCSKVCYPVGFEFYAGGIFQLTLDDYLRVINEYV